MLLTPNNPWRSVDETGSSYWSGTDVKIFIGGIYLEEVVGIQHALQEAVTPVYEYGGFVFKTVMRGSRIIEGTLNMNIKDPGYLENLLYNYTPGITISTDVKVQSGVYGEYVDTMSLYKRAYKQKELTSSIWGDSAPQSVPAGNKPYFIKGEFDHNGVNIVIKFGETKGSMYASQTEGNGKLVQRASAARAITLIGAQFSGSQTLYDDSGKPIIESYPFIAQDKVNGEIL